MTKDPKWFTNMERDYHLTPMTPADFKNLYMCECKPDPTILDGDGREALIPGPMGDRQLAQTRPMSLTRGAARRVVQDFLQNGVVHHSGDGSTAWVIAQYCKESRIGYELDVIYSSDGSRLAFVSYRLDEDGNRSYKGQ